MAEALFEAHFGAPPMAVASAHGRVNLIGEHTDYCEGFALPTLISHKIYVAITPTDDDRITGISSEFGEITVKRGRDVSDSWLAFVEGALTLLATHGTMPSGLQIATSTDIPAGAGVSSSAAFEIALCRALSTLTGITLDANEMARIGQKIEHDFVGTKCGIMDQMAVAHANHGEALFLDCRTLATQRLSLPSDFHLAVIHSGSQRSLSHSAYNERLQQTIDAARICKASSLRDVTLDQIKAIPDKITYQRALHVISENRRVQDAVTALQTGDLISLGILMTQSHASLRDLYEVSSDALDKLVADALAAGAYGARLTGAGFGGCVIALLPPAQAQAIITEILANNPDSWLVDHLDF